MTTDNMKIPAVALGTWAWGDGGSSGDGYFGSTLTQTGLEELADRAHAAGYTLWDTAVVYGMGRSETVLGEVLKRFARSDYQLSTKFTPQAAGTGDDPMADMLEQSLARLGTDYIDLYWIHNPGDVARWTPHLIPLLESGKIKHVGLSNHNLSQIEQANQILGNAGYIRPTTAKEAISAFASAAEGARYIAGGTSLYDLMKLNIERPPFLIDVTTIAGLNEIDINEDRLRFGASVPIPVQWRPDF